MPPLKFRAWHKPTGQIFDRVAIDFDYGGRPTFKIGQAFNYSSDDDPAGDAGVEWLRSNPTAGPDLFYEHDERIVVMQSTGLRDKNGVEVFEGDIVRQVAKVHGTINKLDKWVVWMEQYATFGLIPCTPNLYASLSDEQMAVREVIGNIYQNPDLLPR